VEDEVEDEVEAEAGVGEEEEGVVLQGHGVVLPQDHGLSSRDRVSQKQSMLRPLILARY